jgi:osmotically-inducible protein OsmY
LFIEVYFMGKKALISEMLKFHFGNQIFCTDGLDGILTHVLCDANTKRLTHIAIKQGRFFGKTYCLPLETVTKATSEGIWLTLAQDQLAGASIAEEAGTALNAHTTVQAKAASGTLATIAVQSGSGELAYIVAHNLLHGGSILLQARYVSAIAQGQITLAIEDDTLKSLPPYRTDAELQQEVQQILFDLGFLHIDLRGMKLRVLDAVLYMNGNISSSLRSELAKAQVSGVAGLLEIQDNLVGDDLLAADIALALGQDARTRELPIGVYPELGVVRLSGSVGNNGQANAAVEIATKFVGVRRVLNNLVVDPAADMLYVMSAPEGGEGRDIAPGRFVRHTQ